MAGTNGDRTQIYAKVSDRERLKRLGELPGEVRPPIDQLTVILDEACERRDLDPTTLEPVEATEPKTAVTTAA